MEGKYSLLYVVSLISEPVEWVCGCSFNLTGIIILIDNSSDDELIGTVTHIIFFFSVFVLL